MSNKISLKQFLMKSGRFEKAFDCIEAIRSGKAAINSKTITNPNHFFNPKNSSVKLNNEKIRQASKLYFILNKPAGYICQKSRNEKSVYGLIDKLNLDEMQKNSLFAVGRLDKDTGGLLIITNDGKLASRISNPDKEIEKEYHVKLIKPLNSNDARTLENGVELNSDSENYKTKPCEIRIIKEKEVLITITEGKKRQIRKMFEHVGNKVIYLKRISIGNLKLGELEIGKFKKIDRNEIMKAVL